ncbi:MAG TPA: sigma-70 family RNA polymerase sigma factor [Pirellulales bacterium]|jgi:RNA polymerase sigma-70 factor (ECF subfamily)|nr:sigma-70 family RNA polymerase sigma factor [Pirellulales bacterium]
MNDLEPATVEQLLARAREGDEQQRERLFEACRSYLALVARAQVESWLQAKADASDLVQQTLLEAHRGFDRFEGRTEAEWLAWLRRILRHNAADLVRRYRGTEKRQARREVAFRQPGDDSQVLGAPEPAGREPTPSQQLVARDRDLQIAAALDRLSPDHREVIALRNLERLPFDEVAERMGRSRPAVQMLWARAIKKLQEALEQ